MTYMSINPLWLSHFIEILLVLEFELTKFIVGTFSYKAHFRPQISSNVVQITLNGHHTCPTLVYNGPITPHILWGLHL